MTSAGKQTEACENRKCMCIKTQCRRLVMVNSLYSFIAMQFLSVTKAQHIFGNVCSYCCCDIKKNNVTLFMLKDMTCLLACFFAVKWNNNQPLCVFVIYLGQQASISYCFLFVNNFASRTLEFFHYHLYWIELISCTISIWINWQAFITRHIF